MTLSGGPLLSADRSGKEDFPTSSVSEEKGRGYYGGIESFPDDIQVLSPTDKWGTKTEYARLRKFLLKDGYIRIGPEVFMRVVQNRKAYREAI